MRRAVKIFGGCILALLLALVVTSALLYVAHFQSVTLPRPTGPYPVGRLTALIEDRNQHQLMAPSSEVRRAYMWVWYPSDGSGQRCDYIPTALRAGLDKMRGFLVRDLVNADLTKVRDQSFCGAKVSAKQSAYPLIVLRAGASAVMGQMTVLAEDLASHGYIVVGFDAPWRSELVVLENGTTMRRLPTNNGEAVSGDQQAALGEKLVAAWVADTSWVLDQLIKFPEFASLQGHIDKQRVGSVGFSLGGGTAAQFCHDDDRCKAAVDIDGVMFGSVTKEGMNKPFFLLLGDHSGEADADQTLAEMATILNRFPSETRLKTTIATANHFDFSDVGLVRTPGSVWLMRASGLLKMDAEKQIHLTSLYVRHFLDVYLKGAPETELKTIPAE